MEKKISKNTSSPNKDLVLDFLTFFEEGRRDEVKKLWADSYQLQFPGKQPLSREESIELMKQYNTAFPDLKTNVELQLTDGDYVVTRFTIKGTHKGVFQEIQPTNKRVTSTCTVIHRCLNNKIVEEIVEFDSLGLLQQIGGMLQPRKLAVDAASSTY